MKYEDFVFRARTAILSDGDASFKDLYDEMTKPMGVEEIEDYLHHASWQSKKGLAKIIQPITRQQGFVVDWKEAPGWADGVDLYWSRSNGQDKSIEGDIELFGFILRPAPKYREMTREMMLENLESLPDSKLADLCAAAGIPTKIEVKE